MRTPLSDLLAAWRDSERRWEQPGSPADVALRARHVVAAWVAYQGAALAPATREFMLVADDDGTYAAATEGVTRVLGYAPGDLLGKTIMDFAAPDVQAETPALWSAFLTAGRSDGRFALVAKDGRIVPLQFQARAHHPIPGFHLSRLWPDELAASNPAEST